MRNKIVFFGLLLVVMISIILLFATSKKNDTSTGNTGSNQSSSKSPDAASNPPTDSDFVKAITKQSTNPSLTSGFSIASSNQPVAGWFVVKVATNVKTDQLTALLQQNKDNTLTLIAGPSTQIAQSALQQYDVPPVVLTQIPVYNDVQQ